jgi:hypothetical protein
MTLSHKYTHPRLTLLKPAITLATSVTSASTTVCTTQKLPKGKVWGGTREYSLRGHRTGGSSEG